MKKIKNLFSIFMITFLFLMMGTSLAANTGDTSWSFNFGRTNFNLYTPSREKQDASPIYFYVNNISGDTLKARALAGNKQVTSYAPVYYINKGGKYCISSNIHEDGYRTALVHGSKYSTFSTLSASGLWSPDSWSCGW